MSHVFISYSRKNESYARKLADTLRNEGFDVWIDNDSLRGGQAWWRSIVFAIRDCAAFCVVMSKESANSLWVEDEITLARKYSKIIYPFWLDGTLDEPTWEMLVSIQPVDVRGGKMPPLTFYSDLKIHVPYQQRGADVTAPVDNSRQIPPDVEEELENPLTPETGSSNLKRLLMLLGIMALIMVLLAANYGLEQFAQYQQHQQETMVAIDLTNEKIETFVAETQAAVNLTATAAHWTPPPSITPSQTPTPTPIPRIDNCLDTGVTIKMSGMGGLIRTGPGDAFSTIRRAESGEEFRVTGITADNEYYRIIHDENAEGWVYGFFVQLVQGRLSSLKVFLNPAASGYINNFGALIRSGPSDDYEVIDRISSRWVTITGKNALGNYYLVNYGCQSGWIMEFFITRLEGDLRDLPIVTG